MAGTKDRWDKFDIFIKLLSACVLDALAFFVKSGSDRISLTLEEAGLVQSLIGDLTTREEETPRDILELPTQGLVSRSGSVQTGQVEVWVSYS